MVVLNIKGPTMPTYSMWHNCSNHSATSQMLALSMLQNSYSIPPHAYMEYIVTVMTPHLGTDVFTSCGTLKYAITVLHV